MDKIFIVDGEHPFQGSGTLTAHITDEGANQRAANLVNEIMPDFWHIYDLDHTNGPMPVATVDNWKTIVEQYGEDENFVQDDGWGRWGVWTYDVKLQP